MRVLVTGAAAGLGRELALQLAAGGAEVTVVDWLEIDEKTGFDIRTADLADRTEVDRLLSDLSNGPAFDWIIHNACVSATGGFERLPDSAYRTLLTLNCEIPMVMTSRLQEAGRIASGGRVVFISSLSHFTGYPGGTVYGASKDALTIYAKSIRSDLVTRSVKVLTVFPGPLRTEHAARHAPPQTRAEKRMEPAVLADLVIAAARRGNRVLYPGLPHPCRPPHRRGHAAFDDAFHAAGHLRQAGSRCLLRKFFIRVGSLAMTWGPSL